jgi:hypothetical protein
LIRFGLKKVYIVGAVAAVLFAITGCSSDSDVSKKTDERDSVITSTTSTSIKQSVKDTEKNESSVLIGVEKIDQ